MTYRGWRREAWVGGAQGILRVWADRGYAEVAAKSEPPEAALWGRVRLEAGGSGGRGAGRVPDGA